MLSGIYEAIKEVLAFLRGITNFITDFISDLVYMVNLLGEATIEIPLYFSWLPASITVFLGTILGIVVIYKILGRD